MECQHQLDTNIYKGRFAAGLSASSSANQNPSLSVLPLATAPNVKGYKAASSARDCSFLLPFGNTQGSIKKPVFYSELVS